MTTSAEFVKSGITGQTFREITEKFGSPLANIGDKDPVMALFALGFAWIREREHLQVQAAYDKAMTMTPGGIEALFEPDTKPGVKAQSDFVSPPPTTTP